MYIFKRILGFLMIVMPFGAAFYITKRVIGLEVSLFLWGGVSFGVLYFILAILLLFAQPKEKPDELEEINGEKLRILHQRLLVIEDRLEQIVNPQDKTELTLEGEEDPKPEQKAVARKKSVTKKGAVELWRRQNPNGTKRACAEETGISMSTIYKYWNN